MNLRHQVAVISGASGGIGQALASALAQQHATLALLGRNRHKLDCVAAKLSPATTVRCYGADLASDQQLKATAETLFHDFQSIDILIHAAGVTSRGSVEQGQGLDLDANYRVNVRAPYILTQAMLPALKKSKGQIVFVNSTAGL